MRQAYDYWQDQPECVLFAAPKSTGNQHKQHVPGGAALTDKHLSAVGDPRSTGSHVVTCNHSGQDSLPLNRSPRRKAPPPKQSSSSLGARQRQASLRPTASVPRHHPPRFHVPSHTRSRRASPLRDQSSVTRSDANVQNTRTLHADCRSGRRKWKLSQPVVTERTVPSPDRGTRATLQSKVALRSHSWTRKRDASQQTLLPGKHPSLPRHLTPSGR